MERRTLGKSSLAVSAVGLGCMSMSNVYGKGDEAECIAVVHRALDLGVNFLDSSDMYGWGQNEELLGRALRGHRDQVVLATKFGNLRKPDGTAGVNGRPEYVPQACDASLKRLGVSTIDLYLQHRVDPSVPIEDTVGAMSRLVEAGKVRFIGLSESTSRSIGSSTTSRTSPRRSCLSHCKEFQRKMELSSCFRATSKIKVPKFNRGS